MVFAVNIRWKGFKQDISSVDTMLKDQTSTYAILRYADDVPDYLYKKAMNLLLACSDQITNKKLNKLIRSYAGVAKVGIVMDEELVETIEIPAYNVPFLSADAPRGYSLMIEEVDED